MSTGKAPSRVTDGPYANWGTNDEVGQVSLTNGSTLKLGQPLCIDVTQLGPDNNVPNNGANLPLCERLVATSNANAGPVFGVITGLGNVLPSGVVLSQVAGVPTWTNSSGATLVVTVTVRQLGWAYVFAGIAGGLTTATAGRAVKIGDPLVVSTSKTYAVSSSIATGGSQPAGQYIGIALGTAINTKQAGIPTPGNATPVAGTGAPIPSAGIVSVTPLSLVGITAGTILLIDSLTSGVQESVSVGSISYPTFSFAATQAHAKGYTITGPASNAAISTNLISVAATEQSGLVACYVNCTA